MCIDAREVMTWWTPDPVALGGVGLSSAIYGVGLSRLWRANGRGHGIRTWEASAFALGQLSLLVALCSPIDRLSDLLFSAHMTQHEILLVVAPPLLVLGRPLVAVLWAVPRARKLTTRASAAFHSASVPIVALLLHGIVTWLWHLPSLFEAAMRDDRIHYVQHASFVATAALFWWAIVRGRYGRAGYGLAVLFVFATATHTSVLGALLTVAGEVWYPIYATRALEQGVDAVDDQRLAGLVMWVPAGTVLALAALALFAAWLGESARRVAIAERRRLGS
jgi:putative membrane protein